MGRTRQMQPLSSRAFIPRGGTEREQRRTVCQNGIVSQGTTRQSRSYFKGGAGLYAEFAKEVVKIRFTLTASAGQSLRLGENILMKISWSELCCESPPHPGGGVGGCGRH
jgi:hypothetical protein